MKNAKPYFEKYNVSLDDKVIKKILKIGLYTALNGGRPFSPERLHDNLLLSADSWINANNLQSLEALSQSGIFKASKECFENFDLIKEVSEINTQCTKQIVDLHGQKVFRTFTIHTPVAYTFKKQHLGISRVLQSFEVVLLTVLVYAILETEGLPISLDHDGVLVMYSQKQFKAMGSDPKKIADRLSTGIFANWSSYLLKEPMPIEAKRIIMEGTATEF